MPRTPRAARSNTFISTNPSIHIEVQRALRSLQTTVAQLQNRVAATENGLQGKVGKNESDLLDVAQFCQKALTSNGAFPLPITSQVGRSSQTQPANVTSYHSSAQLPNPGTLNDLAYAGGHLYIWTGAAWTLIA